MPVSLYQILFWQNTEINAAVRVKTVRFKMIVKAFITTSILSLKRGLTVIVYTFTKQHNQYIRKCSILKCLTL